MSKHSNDRKTEPVPPEVEQYAPKKPDPALAQFDAELGNIQETLNEQTRAAAPEQPARAPYPFVKLAREVAQGMVDAAQMALSEAESNLEQAKAHAARLEEEIAERDKQIGSLTDRLKAFGTKIIDAHTQFHNGNGDHQ
jgi:ABC-type transporter Mla subunit MlaD